VIGRQSHPGGITITASNRGMPPSCWRVAGANSDDQNAFLQARADQDHKPICTKMLTIMPPVGADARKALSRLIGTNQNTAIGTTSSRPTSRRATKQTNTDPTQRAERFPCRYPDCQPTGLFLQEAKLGTFVAHSCGSSLFAEAFHFDQHFAIATPGSEAPVIAAAREHVEIA